MPIITLQTAAGTPIREATIATLPLIVIWEARAFLRVMDGYREVDAIVLNSE